MKQTSLLFFCLGLAASVGAFAPIQPYLHAVTTTTTSITRLQSVYEHKLDAETTDWLDTVAHKLRLQAYDLDSGVYGMESKDPDYGIEVVRTYLHMEEDDQDRLGLELMEMAHGSSDHRGLVLVNQEVATSKPIHTGDTIVGVFVGENFKESTTGLDYDETVDVLNRAKDYAKSIGGTTISLELNRLVKRATVHVQIEDESGKSSKFDAKAGDNLRTLLMHHHTSLYGSGKTALHRIDQPDMTSDCGGEGICGTCLVKINQGMSHLNAIGPQEYSMLKGRPASWRATCKTVVGADNEEGSTLRIRLHPWIGSESEDRLQM
ncbi:MAG: hypothetical protein SGARI_001716 [Bacillariaceae sp.]